MYIIEVDDLVYKYRDEQTETIALDHISFKIEKGEYVAILGHNGSGKSTLARHMNALVRPTSGNVLINGMNTKEEDLLWEIRKTCQMVFQNPDNQIVSTIVEDEIAFGPENLGLPREEIRRRVDYVLDLVGMTDYIHKVPAQLSGGQKQRIAIASVLTMKPDVIVFDEPTAMLDPVGRKDVMRTMKMLNDEEDMTIVNITHHMDEAVQAGRVIVIDGGKLVLDGKPKEVFSEVDLLKEIGLDVPQVTELSYLLKKDGYNLADGIIGVNELVDAL